MRPHNIDDNDIRELTNMGINEVLKDTEEYWEEFTCFEGDVEGFVGEIHVCG